MTLRAISGHRDTGFTSARATRLYAQLPTLAQQVAATGLPKLYAPAVKGSLGGPIRFTARLSRRRGWTVTRARRAAARSVARGTGRGLAVAWTWNSAGRRGGLVHLDDGGRCADAAGDGDALERRRSPPPADSAAPDPVGLHVDPAVISPDGDGVADSLTISYALAGRSAVTAVVTDSNGSVVATLFTQQLQGARMQSFPYAAPGSRTASTR